MCAMPIAVSLVNDGVDKARLNGRVTKGARANFLSSKVIVLAIYSSVNDVGIDASTRRSSGIVVSVTAGLGVISVVGSGKPPIRISLGVAVTKSQCEKKIEYVT